MIFYVLGSMHGAKNFTHVKYSSLNISIDSWKYLVSSEMPTSPVECGSLCLHGRGSCNAHRYDKEDGKCHLGKVVFLKFQKLKKNLFV